MNAAWNTPHVLGTRVSKPMEKRGKIERSLTFAYCHRLGNIAMCSLRALSRAMRGMSPWRW